MSGRGAPRRWRASGPESVGARAAMDNRIRVIPELSAPPINRTSARRRIACARGPAPVPMTGRASGDGMFGGSRSRRTWDDGPRSAPRRNQSLKELLRLGVRRVDERSAHPAAEQHLVDVADEGVELLVADLCAVSVVGVPIARAVGHPP